MFYDYAFRNSAVDGITFEGLSGELTIDLYENIALQFNSRNLKPIYLDENDLPVERTDGYILSVFAHCFLECFDYENLPFGSTPEERFKLGSYSIVTGYKNTVDSEGNITSKPYRSPPSFINYPLFTMPPVGIVIAPNVSNFQAYEVKRPSEEDAKTPVDLRFAFNSFVADRGTRIGCGLNLNLTPGVTADLLVFYGYGVQAASQNDGFPTYFYIW
jgi:hypothetical protein